LDTIIKTLRIIIRSILLLLTISIGSFLTLLFQHGTMPTKGLASTITCFFHQSLTTILGIKIKTEGLPNKTATLFVSNHVSWLDIMIIGQIVPVHFLSMIEVKSWPVAGWLATRAGTIYIHRGGLHCQPSWIWHIRHILGDINTLHIDIHFRCQRIMKGFSLSTQ